MADVTCNSFRYFDRTDVCLIKFQQRYGAGANLEEHGFNDLYHCQCRVQRTSQCILHKELQRGIIGVGRGPTRED